MILRELREKAQKISHEAKALLEEMKGADEGRAKELETQFDRAIAESDALYARADKLEANEAREAALNTADPRRPVEDRTVEARGKTADESRADTFAAYIRGEDLTREQRAELRAQSVGTASEGGYTVPTTLANELIVGMKAFGGMLAVSHIIQTSGGGVLNFPTLDDTSNAATRIDENTQVSDANLTFGQKTLNAYKYTTGVVRISSELLQDSAFNVQSVVAAAMAERLGRKYNTDLTVGDGTDDPNGIVTAATSGLTSFGIGAVIADDLLDLIHSVDWAYRPNGKFMFADSTLKTIRKLKDSEGRYIWQPAMSAGEAGTLFGHSYVINNDVATIANSAKPVLFGDFSKYYVRIVKDFTVKRLDERYADYDQIGFIGFARMDADLMDAKAVKALTIKAS